MKKLIIILVIAMMTSPAMAANDSFLNRHQVSLILIPWCHHLSQPSHGSLNESPKGIGIVYDEFEAITFENSHYHQTFFIGHEYKTKQWHPFDNGIYGILGFHLGLMYGYGNDLPNVGGVTIGFAPVAGVGYKRVSVELMALPADKVLFGAGLKIRF